MKGMLLQNLDVQGQSIHIRTGCARDRKLCKGLAVVQALGVQGLDMLGKPGVKRPHTEFLAVSALC